MCVSRATGANTKTLQTLSSVGVGVSACERVSVRACVSVCVYVSVRCVSVCAFAPLFCVHYFVTGVGSINRLCSDSITTCI